MSIKNEHSFRILQLKNKRFQSSGALNKLSIKNIVLPEIYNKDDSTINFVKRVGGQVFQTYSMRNLDLSLEDNFTYYYLVSEMYSMTMDSEKVKTSSSDFKVSIYSTKITESLEDIPVAATGINKFKANSIKVIAYTNHTVGKDNTYSTGLYNFSMKLTPTIVYNTYKVGVDNFAGIGTNSFGFSSKVYPFIYENYLEKSSSILNKFDIKIG